VAGLTIVCYGAFITSGYLIAKILFNLNNAWLLGHWWVCILAALTMGLFGICFFAPGLYHRSPGKLGIFEDGIFIVIVVVFAFFLVLGIGFGIWSCFYNYDIVKVVRYF